MGHLFVSRDFSMSSYPCSVVFSGELRNRDLGKHPDTEPSLIEKLMKRSMDPPPPSDSDSKSMICLRNSLLSENSDPKTAYGVAAFYTPEFTPPVDASVCRRNSREG